VDFDAAEDDTPVRRVRASRFQCISCGIQITEEKEVCPECGAKQRRCTVCQTFVGQKERYLQCPYCKQIAHRSHILEWLKVKGICPYCKRKLQRRKLV
jgi:rRNA maturation endonuclease Nob1